MWEGKNGGGDRKTLKNFLNSEHKPLFSKNRNGNPTIILHKACPPPLHLKLGAVNAIMRKVEIVDTNGYKEFVKKLSIVKESYQGKTFEGNECGKILRNTETLRNLLVKTEFTDSLIKLSAQVTW